MYRGGYGGAGGDHQELAFPVGASTRLHAYADDIATEMYYTGYHPYTLEKVYTARSKEQKLAQRQFFFWYKPEERKAIINELRKIGRNDLINKLYGKS